MTGLRQRVLDFVGGILFCFIILVTLGVDRVTQGGHTLAFLAGGAAMGPQQSFVRLATILIGGSLALIALGYRPGERKGEKSIGHHFGTP